MRWPKELKKTQPRKFVLSVLEKANRPLSAMEIHKKIENQGERVWLSTIYRILELFEEHDLIVKNPILTDETSVYVLNKDKHEHYAQCLSCNRTFTMENCPLDNFNPRIEDESFEIINHRIEIFGYCKGCK